MEDQGIIRLLWDRAEEALEHLARRFGRRLYTTAMHILGEPRDAEETVNDTYLAVWNAIPPQKPNPLAAFVYKIGRNLALKRLRTNTALRRRGDYELSLEELEGCIPAPALAEQVEARELGRSIGRFLDGCSGEDRRIFLRRYWFGDGIKEIAADLRMKPNTVTVRLSRMRSKLREHLKQEGYDHE